MIRIIGRENFKFRGYEYGTDKIIVGDTVLIEKGEVTVIFDEDGNAHEMQPDSVKQFLFTDKHGNEIYVGDDIGFADGSDGSFDADYGVQFTAERYELRAPNYDY